MNEELFAIYHPVTDELLVEGPSYRDVTRQLVALWKSGQVARVPDTKTFRVSCGELIPYVKSYKVITKPLDSYTLAELT